MPVIVSHSNTSHTPAFIQVLKDTLLFSKNAEDDQEESLSQLLDYKPVTPLGYGSIFYFIFSVRMTQNAEQLTKFFHAGL